MSENTNLSRAAELKSLLSEIDDCFDKRDFDRLELFYARLETEFRKDLSIGAVQIEWGLRTKNRQKILEGISFCESLLTTDTKPQKLAMIHYLLGNAYFGLCKYNFQDTSAIYKDYVDHIRPAINNFRLSITYNAHMAEPYVNLGNVYMDIGRLLEAIECYKTALNIDNHHPLAWYNMARCIIIFLTYNNFTVLQDYFLTLNKIFLSKAIQYGIEKETQINFNYVMEQYKAVEKYNVTCPLYRQNDIFYGYKWLNEYWLYFTPCKLCEQCSTLYDSCFDWPVFGTEKSLGYYLSDELRDLHKCSFEIAFNAIGMVKNNPKARDVGRTYLTIALKSWYSFFDKIMYFIVKELNIKDGNGNNIDDKYISYLKPNLWVDKCGNIRNEYVSSGIIYYLGMYDIFNDFEEDTKGLGLVKDIRNKHEHRIVLHDYDDETIIKNTLSTGKFAMKALYNIILIINNIQLNKAKSRNVK